jgi:hypothetical protein
VLRLASGLIVTTMLVLLALTTLLTLALYRMLFG